MREYVMCYSGSEKPSKYEKETPIYRWSLRNNCPDCDKKRTSSCKNPNCKSK